MKEKSIKNSTKSIFKKVNIGVNKIKSQIKNDFNYLSLTDKEIDKLLDYLKDHLEKKIVYYWNTSDFDGINISAGPTEICWETLGNYIDKNLIKLLNKYPDFKEDNEDFFCKSFKNDEYTTKDLKKFEDYLKSNGWTAKRVEENEEDDDLDELHAPDENEDDKEIELTDSIKFLSILLKESFQNKDDNKFQFDFSLCDNGGYDMLGDSYSQNDFREEELTKDEIEKIRNFSDRFKPKSEKEIISMYKNVQFAKINVSVDDIADDGIDEIYKGLKDYARIVKILSSYKFSFCNSIWTGYLMLVENKYKNRFIAGAVIDNEYKKRNLYFGIADDIDKKDFDNNILYLIQHYLDYGIGRY